MHEELAAGHQTTFNLSIQKAHGIFKNENKSCMKNTKLIDQISQLLNHGKIMDVATKMFILIFT